MASIEITTPKVAICQTCGIAYNTASGNFMKNYCSLYKGIGRLSICNSCVEKLYTKYVSECQDEKLAMRQLCRKLDIYWNEPIYNSVMQRSTSQNILRAFLQKAGTTSFVGKSYDDTLREEGILWIFSTVSQRRKLEAEEAERVKQEKEEREKYEVSDEVREFWGPGYDDQMYWELEQRRKHWMSRLPEDTEFDIAKEAIIRQICNLEIDINRDRQAGKSIDKNVTVLNNLISKIMTKDDASNSQLMSTPLGVWLYKYENQRPLPKLDKSLTDNKIKKYIFTWMGHLCKMLGIKNGYTKLYEKEIDRLRVNHPEFEDDDEEDLLIDSYSDEEEEDDDDIDEEVDVYE